MHQSRAPADNGKASRVAILVELEHKQELAPAVINGVLGATATHKEYKQQHKAEYVEIVVVILERKQEQEQKIAETKYGIVVIGGVIGTLAV